MLVLPIKKKWFDMIKDGIKLEEYREIKPYYTTRFLNSGHLKRMVDIRKPDEEPKIVNNGRNWILFRNGYSNSSPSFKALVSVTCDKGNPDWGADKDKLYYVLKIEKIER